MEMFWRFLILIVFFSIVSPSIVFADNVKNFLSEKQKEFPECVRVVRNQLFIIPEENRIAMLPYLFEACKSGRAIGEKRTKKLFQKKKIDPEQ
ncbi:hypothetical protein RYZ26_08355 [Terasakiella sp. A23]|uniref:hypothetical protein n=1 Tax=Terasakiella sp. FCG-A23 TaxID=3080561 RepID=UPI002954DF4A|nr:hypothetical protein [Terasakiella sp. A23]MDV7339600.1 hypothetical protein [Terasakiella sp. A23]